MVDHVNAFILKAAGKFWKKQEKDVANFARQKCMSAYDFNERR
jgi:hypothetical protein